MIRYLLPLLVVASCYGAHFSSSIAFKGQATTGNTLLNQLGTYWKFHQATGATRNDSSSNGENLTDVNGNAVANVGLINNGLRFTGGTQRLKHVDDAILGVGSGNSFTLTCWHKVATTSIIAEKWNTGDSSQQDYALYVDAGGNFGNGFYTWSIKDLGGTQRDLASNFQCSDSTWHFIAVGYDNDAGVMWIQIDRGCRLTKTVTGIRRTACDFSVGQADNGAGGLGGLIDEMGIWQRSLTQTEVSTLYKAAVDGIQHPFSGAIPTTLGVTLSTFTSSWWQNVYNNAGDRSNNGGPVGSNTLAGLDAAYSIINSGSILSKIKAWHPFIPDTINGFSNQEWPFIQNGAVATTKWTSHALSQVDATINGWTGNGSSKYFDSGFQGTDFTSDSSIGVFLYVYTASPGGTYDSGYGNNSGSQTINLTFNSNGGGNAVWWCMNTTVGAGAIQATTPAGGFLSGQRGSPNNFNIFFANSTTPHAVLVNGSTTGGTRQARNLYIGALFAYEGGVPFGFTANTYSSAGMTDGLDATEDTVLYNAIQSYLTIKGGGFR